MIINSVNKARSFHNSIILTNVLLSDKPEYRDKKDSIILLLQAMFLYIAEKGYDIKDNRAVYDIFTGSNLTVLKYKFGSLDKNSEAADAFYAYREKLPDSTVNEDIAALDELLRYYYENDITDEEKLWK